jgi:hypothetical protein
LLAGFWRRFFVDDAAREVRLVSTAQEYLFSILRYARKKPEAIMELRVVAG